MKKALLFITISLFGLNVTMLAQTKSDSKPIVEVYYFHATNRCPTCLSIESNTKKTLETYFINELKDGKIKFTTLNSDDSQNKLICEKYQAYGATLILVKYQNGKENSEDLTNFAFSYSRNQADKFINGLKEKIQVLIQ